MAYFYLVLNFSNASAASTPTWYVFLFSIYLLEAA